MDGVTALAAILIASFAIDRCVTGALFLLSFNSRWDRFLPDPTLEDNKEKRKRLEKKHQLVYSTLAALLAIGVLAGYGNVSILAAVGFSTINPWLDRLLTGLILIGGADRVASLLKSGGLAPKGAAPKSEAQPVEIKGKLILENGREGVTATTASVKAVS